MNFTEMLTSGDRERSQDAVSPGDPQVHRLFPPGVGGRPKRQASALSNQVHKESEQNVPMITYAVTLRS